MGVSVRQKPKGSGVWWIFIEHNGNRKAKKIGRNKKFANKLARKIEEELVLIDLGYIDKKETNEFEKYAKKWISRSVPAKCKPATIRSYKQLLEQHVLPVFGKKRVIEINRLMVRSFLENKITSGMAQSTVKHLRSVISGVLDLALDDDVILVNPAHKLGRIFKKESISEKVNPFDNSELSIFLVTFEEYFPRHYPMALTLARTGMRLGEVIALKWSDIDFHNRLITVQRNFSRGILQTTKSGKSRKVDMSLQLTESLNELKRQRKIETAEKNWKKVPEWVFINEVGNPVDPDKWRRKFRKVLERAGLRRIRIHDLRHTYASLLMQGNESLAYIRDQLGHQSIKVTVDIYGHLTPGGNKQAVDSLDDENYRKRNRNLSATKKIRRPERKK